MKKCLLPLGAFLFGYIFLNGQTDHPELKLWYDKPAAAWEEALPLGNATTGAMVEWKNGKLVKSKIYAGIGGNCRLRSLQPVKVMEVNSAPASGENPNPLYTIYGKLPYEKNSNAVTVEINHSKEYTIDFNTAKGKTYTVVPT